MCGARGHQHGAQRAVGDTDGESIRAFLERGARGRAGSGHRGAKLLAREAHEGGADPELEGEARGGEMRVPGRYGRDMCDARAERVEVRTVCGGKEGGRNCWRGAARDRRLAVLIWLGGRRWERCGEEGLREAGELGVEVDIDFLGFGVPWVEMEVRVCVCVFFWVGRVCVCVCWHGCRGVVTEKPLYSPLAFVYQVQYDACADPSDEKVHVFEYFLLYSFC